MSTIKVNNIEPASGTDITIPTGKNLVITDGLDANTITSGTLADARIPANALNSNVDLTNLSASNLTSGTVSSDRLPTVATTKGGTGLTTIGTANQVLAVNSGATGLEYQTISADITAVTAGDGLTGGGTSGDVTLNVVGGTGIDANANDIAIDSTVATLTGTQTLTNKSIAASQLTGTIEDARFPATLPAANGSALTALDASNISSGTISDARLPANALNSNVDLTNLSASNMTSGTLPDARFPATLPAVSGANLTNLPVDLTNLNATNLTSGTVPDARFPSVLPAVSGANLTNLPGGGGMIPLASSTWTSNVSYVDLQNVFSNTYKSYKIFISSLLLSTDANVYVGYLDSSNNELTAGYGAQHMLVRFQGFGSPFFEYNDTYTGTGNGFQLNGYSTMGYVSSNGDMSAELTIHDPTRTIKGTGNLNSYGYGICAYRNGSVGQSIIGSFNTYSTKYPGAGGGIRIKPSTGSIARGFAVIYGLNT